MSVSLYEMVQMANRPPTPAQTGAQRTCSAAQRAWQQEWARRNREISRKLKAQLREKNDARVLRALRNRPGPRSHAELAAVLGVSQDWLRKHVLPRLERGGLVRRVVVVHPVTGWNLRYDWEIVLHDEHPEVHR